MVGLGSSTDSSESKSKFKNKVIKLIHKYDIAGIGDELEEYWTRETDDRMSLRDLADYFNKALLKQALQQNGTSTLNGEPANYYRVLTADNISSGTRVQAENRLEQKGIDVEQLRTDFVSRQAIHTYLTKERDATYNQPDPSDEERIDARINTIGRLKNRLATVAEQAISELMQSEQVVSGETRVSVLVQVQCIDCNTQYPITQFLTKGGCDCHSTDQ